MNSQCQQWLPTDEKDETLGRGGESRSNGIHAVDDRSLEVDVEDAEHVYRVKNHPEYD